MSRPVTDARLFLRSLRAYAGGLALLAAVALVAAAALAAWPRAVSGILGGELRHDLQQAGAGGRDLSAPIRTGFLSAGPMVDPARLWDQLPAIGASVHRAMSPALRAVTTSGDSAARSDDLPTASPADARPVDHYGVSLEAYRGLRQQARLAQGEWPSAAAAGAPVPVVVTTATAKLLGWKVGETREASGGQEGSPILRLAGTIAPKDAAADFWDLDPVREFGHVSGGGDSPKSFVGVAWVAPSAWPDLAPRFGATTAAIWYPVVPDRFTSETLPAVRSALSGFLASPPVVSAGGSSVRLPFATAVQQPLDDFIARSQPAQTLFAILLSGPLVVALAVLAQGARLVAERRRPALALAVARGASPGRLRAELAAQGALVSVPAAALGFVIALVVTPGAQPLAVPLSLAAVAALLPPIALVLAAGSLDPAVRGSAAAPAGRGSPRSWPSAWLC
ncbi:hypothetical protein ACRAWB_10070 [Leifsonia poae]|uniref:hypothetical protein n=1 Tax=Leifsonia poae TaxID=110933 RepID=UPI003D69DEA1